jgi:hypothetical protein
MENIAIYFDASEVDNQHPSQIDPLTPQLRAAISQSALFLVLMSPHYTKSPWCNAEQNWWFNQGKQSAIPHINRTITISIWPMSDTEWPREFCDERGMPSTIYFYQRPGNRHLTRPVGWTNPNDSTFQQSITHLAGVISVRINELKKTLNLRRLEQEAPSGRALYVHGRTCDKERWESATLNLAQRGRGATCELGRHRRRCPSRKEICQSAFWL